MNKSEGEVLSEIHSLLEDTTDPKQFRRGIESIHDIIHNDIYVADHIMNHRHHGDLVQTYMNIITHSIYAICVVRDEWKWQETEKEPETIDEAIEMVDQMIDNPTPKPFKANEKVPQQNEYSATVDEQLAQLDKLAKPLPISSKNNRRQR